MKKMIFTLFTFYGLLSTALSQGVGINNSNATAHSSAMLDISHTNKGLLIPRIALLGTDDNTTITSPQTSLLIYNTTTNTGSTAVTPGYYYWNGTAWERLLVTENLSAQTWMLGGNIGTDPANNFIGTIDAKPLKFRIANIPAGIISFNSNMSLGMRSLMSATGTNNTAFGYGGLQNTSSGSGNTAVGTYTLNLNTLGEGNTAIGDNTLYSNTTGQWNTATGTAALFHNVSGINNTANGYFALFANTSSYNTAIGFKSLTTNSTGYQNTAVGALALQYNSEGIENTATGMFALNKNTLGYQNTAMGVLALNENLNGNQNTAIGYRALQGNESGYSNTAIGQLTLWSNRTGSNNTALGYGANVGAIDLTNATAIGFEATVNSSNAMRFGNNNVKEWGFGTNVNAGNALQVGTGADNGNGAFLTEGGVWTNVSDEHLKEDFKQLDGDQLLNKIAALRITQWSYKGTRKKETHIGPMAQQFKELFQLGIEGDNRSIGTADASGVALAGIQELVRINQQLAEQVKLQKDMIEKLIKRVEEIEKK